MRVLVADEHAIFREGLRHVVAEVATTPQISEAGRFDEALARSRDSGPFDLILLGLTLPGLPGFDGIGVLARSSPRAAIVVLSAPEDPADVTRALARGARGSVLKSSRAEILQHVLSLVLAGEIYVPPIVMARDGGASTTGGANGLLDKLTPREREVLGWLVGGLSNKAIAQELAIGEGTVKVHLKAVLRKLDVANRTQAATLAVRLGWPPVGAASV